MKVAVFVSIALFGAIGMAAADYYGSDFGIGSISGGLGSYGHGYNYGASVVPVPVPVGGRGGLGSGGLLPLLGLLFLLPLLFNRSNTGSTDQILLINSTLTGGK